MEDGSLIYVEFRKSGNCFVEVLFWGWNFFETEIVEASFKIEFIGGVIFGNVGFDGAFQEVADWFVGLFGGRLNRGTLSFGCAGGGLVIHCGFNICDGNNTVSKDIELFFEGRVDDVTEFLSGFGDDSFEEREETTSDIKFGGAKSSFGGFFIRNCKDGDWSSTFGLLDIVFLADVFIEV